MPLVVSCQGACRARAINPIDCDCYQHDGDEVLQAAEAPPYHEGCTCIVRAQLDERGFLYWRELGEGRAVGVVPSLYGAATLGVGLADSKIFDEVWDYPSPMRAIAFALTWDGDGEPTGWHRHLRTGRYRTDGDPAREYVREE